MWADLIVIAGSSELAHKVSNLGIEAIAPAVVEHVRRHRKGE